MSDFFVDLFSKVKTLGKENNSQNAKKIERVQAASKSPKIELDNSPKLELKEVTIEKKKSTLKSRLKENFLSPSTATKDSSPSSSSSDPNKKKSNVNSSTLDKEKRKSSNSKSTKSSKSSARRSVSSSTSIASPDVYKDALECLKCGLISIRGQVWLLRTRSSRDQLTIRQDTSMYEKLKESPVPIDQIEQIQKDLSRTYPQYDLFQQENVQETMFHILKALASHRQSVGYCQGMGYVAAFLSTMMPEEDAFWLMVQLIDNLQMADFWSPSLPGIPRAFFVLEKLLEFGLPKLSQHFKDNELETSMYATPWMMTLFLYNHSIPFSMRLWDMILFEGFYYVYVIALSLLTIYEDQLLSMSFDELIQFLQFSCKKLEVEPDVEEVLRIAGRIKDTVQPNILLFEKEYLDHIRT
eukprot:TRINITY_DN2022_c2_g3_i1.p1 TRINITY_DN2022_c2_g3~~TRINITY_DN2022_c2_g3_i1.p1  ORF type:complete len:411 (+),score=154.97 TRINITY_DN2022_c2_g3_i1:300-1532(+)